VSQEAAVVGREIARGIKMKINRRKLLSLFGISPAILAGSPTFAEAAGKKAPAATGPAKIETLNPKGMPPAVQLVPMAPRLDTLDGKTVFLVSDGFAGADRFLAQIAIWFQKNMPSVKTVYRLKAGSYFDDDPKLMAEIKASGNAMIMAYGH
jgi:hypothetical protein